MAAFTQNSAASAILTNVLQAIGIAVPSIFVGSTDLTINQFVTLFSQAGRSLAAAHDWQDLHKEWTLTTTTTTLYDLPTDFNGFVNGAQWDNTNRWPMIGSVPPALWRMMKARLSGGQWAMVAYKLQANQLVLFNAPANGSTYVMDYYSAGWLRKSSDPTVYYDNLQADSDVCVLDSLLMEYLVELSWRAEKGFDTTNIENKFNSRWDTIVGRDTPAPTLSVGQTQQSGLLGYANIPDTGYGS